MSTDEPGIVKGLLLFRSLHYVSHLVNDGLHPVYYYVVQKGEPAYRESVIDDIVRGTCADRKCGWV